MAYRAVLSNFFEEQVNSKPPTMPFGIVACRFFYSNQLYALNILVRGVFDKMKEAKLKVVSVICHLWYK